MKIKALGATDVGKVRSANQDAFLINDQEKIYIVADGMGGHAGGEIASQMCTEEIHKHLRSLRVTNPQLFALPHPNKKFQNEIMHAINHASAKIYERALEEPNLKGMGTTATVLFIVGDHAYFGHVGDSRLYLLRAGFIYQMTYDHSLVSEQVRAGVLTKEEAEAHHLRNVITRSVGYQEEEDVDSGAFGLEPNDYLLLCSDGLHGKISDAEIIKVINERPAPSTTELINLANQRGGDDNITTIVVQVQVQNPGPPERS